MAFMAFLVAVPAAAAQSTWAVRVAVLNYPNFIEREKNGTVSGFAAEYLNDIVDYIGWTDEYADMPFGAALEAVHDGTIDFCWRSKSAGTQLALCFSESSMGQNGALLCVKAEDIRYAYRDYESFDSLCIGGIKESAYVELCENYRGL